MNHNLRHFVISRIYLLKIIIFFFNVKNKKLFNRIIEKRKNILLYDYKELVANIPYAPTELVIDNNFYGIAYSLKLYAGIDPNKSTNVVVEHGVFLGSIVRKDDLLYKMKTIVTFGDQRVIHLKNSLITKKIIPIGPLIHYAESLLNDTQMKDEKRRLGRTLLVFPSHSTKGIASDYDIEAFICEIEKIRTNYNTVLISLFWLDGQNEAVVKKYEKRGYKIVTSGHRHDINFLSRQKSLILLSDYTMSNSVGTHVGYCVYLNKPHYIFTQIINYKAETKKIELHDKCVRNQHDQWTAEEENNEILSAFSNFAEEITIRQKEIVDKYWGISHLKSKNEIFEILTKKS